MVKQENNIVNIYTHSMYAQKCAIKSNDQWFSNVRIERDFLQRHEHIMREVDKIKEIDYDTLTIITPFGSCSIDNLSTGCKTLLNILYWKETYPDKPLFINVTEAGSNVMQQIFKAAAGTNISLYLRHCVCPEDMNLIYHVNNAAVEDEFEFLEKLCFD